MGRNLVNMVKRSSEWARFMSGKFTRDDKLPRLSAGNWLESARYGCSRRLTPSISRHFAFRIETCEAGRDSLRDGIAQPR